MDWFLYDNHLRHMKELKGLYCRVPTQMFSGTLLNFLGELLQITLLNGRLRKYSLVDETYIQKVLQFLITIFFEFSENNEIWFLKISQNFRKIPASE